MKWNKPVHGDSRVKKKFLIFPKTLQNFDRTHEITRWLERAEIMEGYERIGVSSYHGDLICRWKPICWSDI